MLRALQISNSGTLEGHAKRGRVAAQREQAQAFRAETQRRHEAAKAAWSSADLPAWLNKENYVCEIQPKLKGLTLSVLASTLAISIPYAVSVRNGKRIPHPRHWEKLAVLVEALPIIQVAVPDLSGHLPF